MIFIAHSLRYISLRELCPCRIDIFFRGLDHTIDYAVSLDISRQALLILQAVPIVSKSIPQLDCLLYKLSPYIL